MNARELEVRCAHCDAGFAIGTRTCIHCGQRIGAGARSAPADPFELRPQHPGESPAEPEGADAASGGPSQFWERVGPGFITLLLVLLGIVTRACSGAGH